MLILTRKPGESLMIGDEIRVMIADPPNIPGNKSVRIGIDAPKDVHIVRDELIERRTAKPQD